MNGKKLREGYLVHINRNVYMHIEKRKEAGLRGFIVGIKKEQRNRT